MGERVWWISFAAGSDASHFSQRKGVSGHYFDSLVGRHQSAGSPRDPSFRVGQNPGTKQEMEGFPGRRMGVNSELLEGQNGDSN
jgi:hypothetical protein